MQFGIDYRGDISASRRALRGVKIKNPPNPPSAVPPHSRREERERERERGGGES